MMMRLDKDDPRLMDYALGELDTGDMKVIEAALDAAENHAARDAVEAYRSVGRLATDALGAEPAETLTEEQREAVLAGAAGTTNIVPMRRGRRAFWGSLAVAAAVAAASAAVVLLRRLGRMGH
jgi:hypothetical protein